MTQPGQESSRPRQAQPDAEPAAGLQVAQGGGVGLELGRIGRVSKLMRTIGWVIDPGRIGRVSSHGGSSGGRGQTPQSFVRSSS